MEYKVEKNKVEILINNKSLNIELLNKNIIRLYAKKNRCDLIDLIIKKGRRNFEVKKEGNSLVVIDRNYKLLFNEDESVSLYFKDSYLTSISFNKLFDEVEKRDYFNTSFKSDNNDNIFGLGDKMAYLDKKGYFWASWATDDSNHQDELFPSLYKSINYLLLRSNKKFFGVFFPSTFRLTFDACKTDLHKLTVNNFEEEQDMFLVLGDDIKEVTRSYSELVGHPYFIRMKMLGYQQSRWSYENEEMVKTLRDNFIKHDIPLDYVHLDIHYMDGYRDFTIDKTRFPDIKKLSEELKKDEIELVGINDAAIKEDPEFDLYKYLEDNHLFGTLDGKTYINAVWPGDSGFPNYFDDKCKKYFENYASKFLDDTGISGIWCDMNEPASFNGPLPDEVDFTFGKRKLLHKEAHNVYAEHMVKSFVDTFKKKNIRPYLFSRAAFATTAKYSFVWNGDNFSLWHHLRYSIPQILSLSMSGFMFNGVDIGGFGGDSNKELLIRWLEANLFVPFLRNHSTLHTKAQEPYAYDEETLNIFKKYLKVRYEFIPYLYNLAHEMSFKGEPMVSPLFYHFEDDENTLEVNDEYMVGDSLLVAPILDKDARRRMIYLPKGTWIDLFTGKKYIGGKYIIFTENLAECGYFVKNNTLIPMFENLKHIKKSEIDTLVIKVFGNSGKVKIYEDDGETLDYEKGIYNIYEARVNKDRFTFKKVKGSYDSPFKKIKLVKDGETKIFDFKDDLSEII